MQLLIDAGNSRIKWAYLSQNNSFTAEAQAHTNNAVEICKTLFLRQVVTRIVLSHVLGKEFDKKIREIASENIINLLIVHSHSEAYGVKNNYFQAKKLGVDRFVAMVAAHHFYTKQDCIVIDCGTAVTIDSISRSGQHNGGVIFPGLRLCEDSLIHKASNLKELKDQLYIATLNIHGETTAQGIKTGCHYSLAATIDRICKEMETLFTKPKRIKKILCGGDAKQIKPLLHGEYELSENLVLQGLQVIANCDV